MAQEPSFIPLSGTAKSECRNNHMIPTRGPQNHIPLQAGARSGGGWPRGPSDTEPPKCRTIPTATRESPPAGARYGSPAIRDGRRPRLAGQAHDGEAPSVFVADFAPLLVAARGPAMTGLDFDLDDRIDAGGLQSGHPLEWLDVQHARIVCLLYTSPSPRDTR